MARSLGEDAGHVARAEEGVPMNRRGFLTGAAVFSADADTAAASRPGGAIDCQSHVFVPELLDRMSRSRQAGMPYVEKRGGEMYVVVKDWVRRLQPRHADIEAKVRDMEANGIQMSALSINDPGPELFGSDGHAIARLTNDFIADCAKRFPNRFFGLCTLPLQDMAASEAELERCIGRLGMRGILLYSNLGGRFPDEEPFQELFGWAESRGIPVLLHPAYPVTYAQTQGYEMAAGLGLMFDTTIALARLILSGTLERHPRLKLVCPHAGGALPYLIGRIDHQTQVLKRGAARIRKAPSEYLRGVTFDTVSPIAAAIRYAIDFAGIDRMLFSSDHPWVDPSLILAQVDSLALPPESREKVLRGNAIRLFGLEK
jgi:predicted TIM-barrel fold metal-dependent hydrolase